MVGVMKMRCWLSVVLFVTLGAVLVATDVVIAEVAGVQGLSGSAPGLSGGVEPFNAQSSALRMVGGLLLCFGLLGLGLHIYKRYLLPRTFSDRRRMHVVERLQLSQKNALVLVKFDGKEFLMSAGSENCRLVSLPRESEEIFDETLTNACQDVGEYNA